MSPSPLGKIKTPSGTSPGKEFFFCRAVSSSSHLVTVVGCICSFEVSRRLGAKKEQSVYTLAAFCVPQCRLASIRWSMWGCVWGLSRALEFEL